MKNYRYEVSIELLVLVLFISIGENYTYRYFVNWSILMENKEEKLFLQSA